MAGGAAAGVTGGAGGCAAATTAATAGGGGGGKAGAGGARVLLYIADCDNSVVQVFDALTGSFVCQLSPPREEGHDSASKRRSPWGGALSAASALPTDIRSSPASPSRRPVPKFTPMSDSPAPSDFAPYGLTVWPSADGRSVTVFVSDRRSVSIQTFEHDLS